MSSSPQKALRDGPPCAVIKKRPVLLSQDEPVWVLYILTRMPMR